MKDFDDIGSIEVQQASIWLGHTGNSSFHLLGCQKNPGLPPEAACRSNPDSNKPMFGAT